MAVVFCCLLSFLLFSYMFNTSSGHICFSCLDVCFIIFGWSSFFWIQIRRVWSKMTKKFCLVHFISQEPYIIWFSFMVLMCKMILPPQIFFILSKFWFSELLGGKRVNSPKWQNIWSVVLDIPGTIHLMIIFCGTQV